VAEYDELCEERIVRRTQRWRKRRSHPEAAPEEELNCLVRFASRNDEWGNRFSDNGDVTIGAGGLH
jgi:hypothetical protein